MTTTFTVTEIALNKLDVAEANVRRTGQGNGIEELAASIGAHGLLQSLVVRPQLDDSGDPTGRYEVVAGGRRLTALKLLAKRKAFGKAGPVPCRVLDGEDAGEASLAENVVRLDMHPADQFEAFARLHRDGRGLGIEDIAARFGVSAHTVRQRLRLSAVSPRLLQAYRDEALTLDQVMAFAVTGNQAEQERLYGQLQDWQRNPDTIRRLLTHSLVPATDRKVIFVGLDAYTAAGGTVQRDLFSEDRGGWITDAALLERLVAEHLERAAETVRAEGWKWVAVGLQAPEACWQLRRIMAHEVPLSETDAARRLELAVRFDALAEQHEGDADVPDEVEAELVTIERELDAIGGRERVYRPEDIARAGAAVSLNGDGTLRVERGYLRPEDEAEPETPLAQAGAEARGGRSEQAAGGVDDGGSHDDRCPDAVEPKAPALSAALTAELEAHRTAGLQAELARQPELALRVLLHGLATDAFYGRYGETVAAFTTYPPALAAMCPGFGDSPARKMLDTAEADMRDRLPGEHGELWGWLRNQDMPALLALLAVCVARCAHAGGADWTEGRGTGSVAAQVAQAAGLDMRTWWQPTVENYLGRVPKTLILDAVRDGAGEAAACRIAGMKKEAMAANAAGLLDGTGWLPQVLRMAAETAQLAAE
jgi:ParB family chromosome partitioning protein